MMDAWKMWLSHAGAWLYAKMDIPETVSHTPPKTWRSQISNEFEKQVEMIA